MWSEFFGVLCVFIYSITNRDHELSRNVEKAASSESDSRTLQPRDERRTQKLVTVRRNL